MSRMAKLTAMKMLAVFIAAVAFAALLGCSKESDDLIGNWKLDLAQTLNTLPGDFGVDQIVNFRSDGSFTWTYSEKAGVSGDLPFSTDGGGTWKLEDGMLTLSSAGSVLYAGYLQWSHDRRMITLSGPPPIVFSKL
jgi:hypothetical protein